MTARRFVLGRQGLWPGRRWVGLEGAAEALRAVEAVQMDPLNVVARSHEIVLWSRVLDYTSAHLEQLMYQERRFFDYGDGLFIYPMAELPYWRAHMHRCSQEGRWAAYIAANPVLLDEVRAELRTRGPLGNRDFSGRARVHSYRGRKDTALALYALWLTGELMIHHRQGFERVYDFDHHIAPPELLYAATDQQAEEYFARKVVAFSGLVRERPWANSLAWYLRRRISVEEGRQLLAQRLEQGLVAPVTVQGSKDRWYVLASDLPVLDILESGRVPPGWQPLAAAQDEALLLAPLDIVSARGRAAWLFDFDYVWEVYKPADTRRWGYYTLPILYGDRLVARLDSRLDRAAATWQVTGFWLEEHAPLNDPAFTSALGSCLAHFASFLNARQVDLTTIEPLDLRARLEENIGARQH